MATQIIPAGFRITLSQNAQTFDVETTVFANGVEFEEAAKRAREALGVGRVRVSQVASGIGDITIVVGKDFTVDGDERERGKATALRCRPAATSRSRRPARLRTSRRATSSCSMCTTSS